MSRKKILTGILVLTIIALAVVGYIFFQYHFIPKNNIQVKISEDSVVTKKKEIPKMYNIPIDSFRIVTGKIKRNQTLGKLLGEFNVPNGYINKLHTISRDSFDLRKIRAGNNYTAFLDKDSLATLRYFVYEHSYVDYNVLCFFDSLWAQRGKKDVKIVRKNIRGKIESSLWIAMLNAEANPLLANDLSDIYAWTIDFFGLQKGDSFAVVCDEHFIDTISIGYGRIHTSYFNHSNTDFIAIPFTQGGIESYYDPEGKSLRKAFLKAPLKFSRISSGFSHSRMHPILKIPRPHLGVDYAAPSGTPVYAIGDGKIIKAARGYNRGGGNMIKIRHNAVYSTAYLHLKGFAKGISTGKYIKQGELIGYVGSTGLSTGPHLDFRFYKNGKAINPLKVKAPPVEPIHDTNKVAFDSVKTETLKLLNPIVN